MVAIQEHENGGLMKRSVANLSLSSGISEAFNEAVASLVAAGVVVEAAGGNDFGGDEKLLNAA